MTITGHALILISGYILHKTLIQNLPHIEDQFNHAHHQLTIYFYLPFLILIGAHIEDVAHTYNNPVSNFSFKGENGSSCPYEYILSVYGRNHFSKFVDTLRPDLSSQDPSLYGLVLEVMDAIHFGAILVDDVADKSLLRKGKSAAHCIFGPSETINRAYLRIMEVIGKCTQERPSLVPFVLDNLAQIHKGQDISLVWRRDGFQACKDRQAALDIYRNCASLKTGALFRLLGQLLFESHEKDEMMSQVGWFCHLQNDCKNIYSGDVMTAKGALAEDLINGEYSYPILVALYGNPETQNTISKALGASQEKYQRATDDWYHKALVSLQSDEVKGICIQELDRLNDQVSIFAAAWGRTEKMT
ncbi:MAG: hypothetical protein ASARMPRED_008248 [Alectoria sarmentosa]|nr:MAG: hypothetical protein ASARMPRED_008248 [Alectoria sarmentosa]